MNTEPRRWTLHRPVNDGNTYATGSYSDMREHIPVIEAAAYDALLAERDALKAELVTERRWAERMKSPELLRTVLVNQLADQIDALKAALAALKIENAELDATTNMQHLILDATATVLKGPPAPLSLHSFADLAQVAAALKAALAEVQWGPEPRTKDSECPYCLQNHRSGHDAQCAVGRALTTSATESREAKGGEQC